MVERREWQDSDGAAATSREPARWRRSARFLQVIQEFDRALVVAHDNPDPDAISTGWAIMRLIESKLRLPVRMVAGGHIVRAENRQMVELLGPPIELMDCAPLEPNTAIILVDAGLDATNHLLAGSDTRPVAVIDHHVTGECARIPFRDIRPRVAASASIATSYLKGEAVEPGEALATALLYALKTETRGSETFYSSVDRAALTWLTKRSNPGLLAEIENAPLSRDYYADLVLALQGTLVYEDSAFCLLPRAEGPEIVGEIADLIARCRGIHRVFCGTLIEGNLLISVRTDKQGGNATALLQSTLEGCGYGGGHRHRAGGKILDVSTNHRVPAPVVRELKARWLSACEIADPQEARLIPRRDIVQHL